MVAYERWSLRRGFKYGDSTCKLLVFWKTGRWGEVVSYSKFWRDSLINETTIENDFHFDSNFKNISQWYLESQREIHITVEIRKYNGKINEWQKQLNAVMKHFSLTMWRDWDIQGFKICKLANWWCHALNQILIKYDEERYFSQFVSEMFDSLQ